MTAKNRIICIGLIVALAGCLPDTDGKSPPSDELIFPVGLSTTPNGKYLIILNSNFDLLYNAGTVVALSLDKIRDIQQYGGDPEWLIREIQQNGGDSEWMSRDGKTLHIPEEVAIDANDTIRVDAFASDLNLTPDGSKAIVPVRGGRERSIVIIEVDENKQSGKVLSCGENSKLKCDSDHRVTSNDRFTLPLEPYEVASMVYYDKDDTPLTVGFATHLYSGDVSAFLIDYQGELDARLLEVAHSVVPEASGIDVRPDPDNSNNNMVLVSGRSNALKFVSVLKLITGSDAGSFLNKPFFGPTDKISLSGDLYGGTDARGIAVTSSGDTAYMVTRTPEALLRIDLKTKQMIDMTTLGTDPSVVSIYEDEETGSQYAFVVCFKSSQVYVVDPETMQVFVRTTGSGPHAIAFDKQNDWAYIANFRESTITVIEALPPFDHVRVEGTDTKLTIGKPQLPENR